MVVTSGKGGVGKTTATANLGMCIARLGYKVALLDAGAASATHADVFIAALRLLPVITCMTGANAV